MKLFDGIDRKRLLIASLFVLLVLVYESFVFGEYRKFISKSLQHYDNQSGSIKFLAVFFVGYFSAGLLLLIFVYLSLASTALIKAFYFCFFSLTAFYEFTYQNLYGRFSLIQDLSLAMLTTPAQRLDAFLSYISFSAFIPCLVYLILLVSFKQNQKFTLKKSLSVFVIFFFLLSGFNLAMWLASPRYYFYEALNNSFGAGSRTLFGFVFTKTFYSPNERETVESPAAKFAPINNIVLIVDESVRGDHLSLNGYTRPTTPFLDELLKRKLLQNWGITTAASTRSVESFQYITTGFLPDDTADIRENVRQMPALFQYAKAMNYRTFYFDGQQNEYWVGDSADMKYIDVLLGTKYFNPQQEVEWNIDLSIAAKTNEIITASNGNFIIVFKHGNHTPYNKNFPPEKAVWQPTATTFAHNLLNLDRETFINTYDNAINYNLNGFFQTLASDYGNLPNNTVIIYTSDHGQTLSENGEIYSHGGESRNEANVPLFILGNLNREVDTNFKAMHANIFATVLDLINYPEEMRKYKYASSLLKATKTDSKERYFITPNVMPGDKIISTGVKIKFD